MSDVHHHANHNSRSDVIDNDDDDENDVIMGETEAVTDAMMITTDPVSDTTATSATTAWVQPQPDLPVSETTPTTTQGNDAVVNPPIRVEMIRPVASETNTATITITEAATAVSIMSPSNHDTSVLTHSSDIPISTTGTGTDTPTTGTTNTTINKKSNFSRIFAKVFGRPTIRSLVVAAETDNNNNRPMRYDTMVTCYVPGDDTTTTAVDPSDSFTTKRRSLPKPTTLHKDKDQTSSTTDTTKRTKKRKLVKPPPQDEVANPPLSKYLLKKKKLMEEQQLEEKTRNKKLKRQKLQDPNLPTIKKKKKLREKQQSEKLEKSPLEGEMPDRMGTVSPKSLKTKKAALETSHGPAGTVVVTERNDKRGRPIKTTFRPTTSVELHQQLEQIKEAVAVVTQTLRRSAYPALFMNHDDIDNQNGSVNHNHNDTNPDNGRISSSSANRKKLSFWPSPYRTLTSRATASLPGATQLPEELPIPMNSMTQHYTHMSSVCASIEKFANDVVQPALLSEIQHTLVPERKKSPNANTTASDDLTQLESTIAAYRTFFGTLLLLRELLIQNIHAIFGPSVMMSLTDQRGASSSSSPSSPPPTTFTNGTLHRRIPPELPSVHFSLCQVQEFEQQIFVTAIILTGIQNAAAESYSGHDKGEAMMDAFLYCMDMYEYVNVLYESLTHLDVRTHSRVTLFLVWFFVVAVVGTPISLIVYKSFRRITITVYFFHIMIVLTVPIRTCRIVRILLCVRYFPIGSP